MPLSEEELRLLEQMERALVQEDPKLASTLRGTNVKARTRRHLVLSGASFAAGVGLLMTGAVTQMTAIGIIGFMVMLASAYLGLSAYRGQGPAAPAPPSSVEAAGGFTVIQGGKRAKAAKAKRARAQGSFMERMEERWRRRREEGY